MSNSLMSVGMKHHIRNSRKNIINLEEGAKVNISSTVDIDQESTQSEFQTSAQIEMQSKDFDQSITVDPNEILKNLR